MCVAAFALALFCMCRWGLHSASLWVVDQCLEHRLFLALRVNVASLWLVDRCLERQFGFGTTRCSGYRLVIFDGRTLRPAVSGFVTVEAPKLTLGGGGHVMSRHERAKSRGLWLALARQVVDIRSMHGRLYIPHSPGRVAVTGVANIFVVTGYARCILSSTRSSEIASKFSARRARRLSSDIK